MKKYILVTSLCLSLNAHAQESNTTIQIISDDSGVLIEASEAQQYKLALLSHIKQLIRKREFANAHIDVISTSMGRTIWSGTPSDLKRKPERAANLVKSIKADPENCNNLPGAFIEMKSNLRSLIRNGYSKAYLIIFSSLIHTPRPCDQTTQVVLPQLPPMEGNINEVLTSFDIVQAIHFYWVSPHQTRVWDEFLHPSFDWASTHNVPMGLMDIERSKYSLQQGLNWRMRR